MKRFVVLLLFVACSAFSDIYTVNVLTDGVDANPGDGICEQTVGMGDCTLRAAITEANIRVGFDEIHLGAGTHLLTLPGVENANVSGDFDVIDAGLAISGVGIDDTIIDANYTNRIFEVSSGGFFSLSYLTVTRGYAHTATEFTGGGVNAGGNGTNVVIDHVSFIDNIANAGGGIDISFDGEISISYSLFDSNKNEDLGFTNRDGPAIYCNACVIVNINSSTFTENNQGPKAIVLHGGEIKVINSTFSNNEGGGIYTQNANGLIKFTTFYNDSFTGQNLSHYSFDHSHVMSVENSILYIDSMLNMNCQNGADMPVSLGGNIVSDSSCSFTQAGDLQNTDALLLPLKDNGGITMTHMPGNMSPAVDTISVINCTDLLGSTLLYDQRGTSRPINSSCDAGSVESDLIFIDGFEL
ncbi:MAG: CSLREA domain-containing protein [Xanthomonadales bacterium]|nr:CSLREA domain-containing protein [Xanthomonadales bacterium]